MQDTPQPAGIGAEFMERTKYRYIPPSDQERGIPQPSLEFPADAEKRILPLADPGSIAIPPLDLRTAIERRRSVRSYVKEPLSAEELAFLLWCTQGVRHTQGTYATFRTVPSAGARHAFETYLLLNDVPPIDPGLYRYLALSHGLQQVRSDPTLHIRMAEACLGQEFIMRCAAVFLWVAVPYRMTWRYGERGYRELHKDAGHVCQNLYLAAEAIGCGVCAIAAFDDDRMAEILGIDGTSRFLIYLATVGKKWSDR
jgi:SagB-type dehydrogenase family enzyme